MFYLFYTSLVELKYKYRYISPPPPPQKNNQKTTQSVLNSVGYDKQ